MNDLNISNLIIQMVGFIITLIPIITIIYRQGRKDQTLEEAIRDINGLGDKITHNKDSFVDTVIGIKTQMEKISITLAEMKIEIGHIQKNIEEVKKNGNH